MSSTENIKKSQKIIDAIRKTKEPKVITLNSNETFIVNDIIVGLDLGDDYHHMTTDNETGPVYFFTQARCLK